MFVDVEISELEKQISLDMLHDIRLVMVRHSFDLLIKGVLTHGFKPEIHEDVFYGAFSLHAKKLTQILIETGYIVRNGEYLSPANAG